MSVNKELVRTLVRCFNEQNTDELSAIITDDVKHTAGGSAFDAELEGRDDFMKYMQDDVLAKFNKIHFDPYNIFEDKEMNVVTAEWRGDFDLKNGKSFSSKGVFVVDIKDGKIDWVRDYFDTEKTKQATS
ncbi:MAG: ketosteroid isomerase-like protein [Gammaproteobacteria bacterium]|jgi:ketosteroid isomerase-like protein